MFKKDYLYAGVIGLITAFFSSLILISTNVSLWPWSQPLPTNADILTPILVFSEILSRGIWIMFIVLPILEYTAYFIASRLFSHITVLRQLGRFGIVGLMNFSVDTGILMVLSTSTGIYSGVWLLALNTISASIAIANSYFWQRTWTFAEKAPPTRKEFFAFLTVTVLGIGVNGFLVSVLTTMVPPFDGLNTPARVEVAAKVGATLVTLFWNFLGYKFIVFKE